MTRLSYFGSGQLLLFVFLGAVAELRRQSSSVALCCSSVLR